MKYLLLICFIATGHFLMAQNNSAIERKKDFNTEANWALENYDVVSYFNGRPLKGDRKLAIEHLGIKYAFATKANLDTFKKNPNRYEPQYGGWCAYAMGASGEKVEVDPLTFKILNDKLYLFYHSWTNNTLDKWNKAEASLKIKADKNWQNFIK